jgi:hypothetical protein
VIARRGPQLASSTDVGPEDLVLVDLACLSGEGDLTSVQKEDEVGDRECSRDVLLDDQERRTETGDPCEELEDLVDDDRGEPER